MISIVSNKMFDIQSARINTAGAYVSINGLYVFAIGAQLHHNQIPIIRLGGHREDNETGWQCAAREVFEESNLKIKPLLAKVTYLYDWEVLENEPQKIAWQREDDREPVPCLVVMYRHDEATTLSLMYLADADGIPVPSSEVKGLLLLQEKDIYRLCKEPTTLQQYLGCGGKAIIKDNFDTSLFLEPFAQLRLLSRLLSTRALTTNHFPLTTH